MPRINKILTRLRQGARQIREIDTVLINQGRLLTNLYRDRDYKDLHEVEFKIFSQWGEDGIIQYLINNLNICNKTFIEFGVESFSEANCRFLMMKDFWSGFVIDGSRRNIDAMRSSYFYFMYQLDSVQAFITRDNIADLLEQSGFEKDLGILSIDIDGVDYHIYEALGNWQPAILIFEYNSLFGTMPLTVPYDPAFERRKKHYSNQYWGAGLAAFDYLATKRGYALVGVNGAGSNAFFVRRDLLNDRVRAVSVETVFREAAFRDSTDLNGNLTFLSGDARREVIANLPLVNVVTGETVSLRDAAGKQQ